MKSFILTPSSLHLHPFVNEPYPWDVPPLPLGWAPLILGLHAARHSDARSDGGQNRDECLNHQFPNISLFHSFIYNLPFTMYNSVIQFPSLTGRVREGLPSVLTGHIAKIQFCTPGCQEAPPFWRRFNTSRACHSECSEESECASKSIILLMFTDSSVPSE